MRFPRIKDGHRPVRLPNNRIRIGGTTFGTAALLHDESGFLWEALSLFDGTRTLTQIKSYLINSFKNQDPKVIADTLDKIARSPYIEYETDDTFIDTERYSRSTILYQWMDLNQRKSKWEIQEAISGLKIAVLGVGGVGSYLALNMVQKGYNEMLLIDNDVVEISNLNRQFFTEADLGKRKIDALIEVLSKYNSSVKIDGMFKDAEDERVLDFVYENYDCIAVTADSSSELRFKANQKAIEYKKPWVHGGYQGPQIIAGAYSPNDSGCFSCLHDTYFRDASFDILEMWNEKSIPPRNNAANATTTMLTGALLSHLVDSLMVNVPKLPKNSEFWLNLLSFETQVISTDSKISCSVCERI